MTRKIRWSADGVLTSDGDEIGGEFTVADDAAADQVQALVDAALAEHVSASWHERKSHTGIVDWSLPVEIVHICGDGEEEIGNCRLIGESGARVKYTKVIEISWNPPGAEIDFCTPDGWIKDRNRDEYWVRNATQPAKPDREPSPPFDPMKMAISSCCETAIEQGFPTLGANDDAHSGN